MDNFRESDQIVFLLADYAQSFIIKIHACLVGLPKFNWAIHVE